MLPLIIRSMLWTFAFLILRNGEVILAHTSKVVRIKSLIVNSPLKRIKKVIPWVWHDSLVTHTGNGKTLIAEQLEGSFLQNRLSNAKTYVTSKELVIPKILIRITETKLINAALVILHRETALFFLNVRHRFYHVSYYFSSD